MSFTIKESENLRVWWQVTVREPDDKRFVENKCDCQFEIPRVDELKEMTALYRSIAVSKNPMDEADKLVARVANTVKDWREVKNDKGEVVEFSESALHAAIGNSLYFRSGLLKAFGELINGGEKKT